MSITGPYYKSFQTAGSPAVPGAYKYFRTWHRQSRPYVHPLPFSFLLAEVLSGDQISVDNMTFPDVGSAITEATNKAYSRLKDEFTEQAESQMAANLAERRQTIDAMVKRVTQLRKFTVAVKRFQFSKAARILGLDDVTFRKKVRPRLGRTKSLANNWIEYHFGWEPLVKDLGSAMDILQGGIPPPVIKGSAKAYRNSRIPRSGHWSESGSITRTSNVRVHMGAKVFISNPNAHLASSMGLVNPISVAWELVPFSFIVDWFANVGQVLQSMTDFVGASITDAYTTTYTSSTQDILFTSTFTPGIAYLGSGKQVTVDRTLGLTGPSLAIKPFRGFSVTRGATAIALLLQVL